MCACISRSDYALEYLNSYAARQCVCFGLVASACARTIVSTVLNAMHIATLINMKSTERIIINMQNTFTD